MHNMTETGDQSVNIPGERVNNNLQMNTSRAITDGVDVSKDQAKKLQNELFKAQIKASKFEQEAKSLKSELNEKIKEFVEAKSQKIQMQLEIGLSKEENTSLKAELQKARQEIETLKKNAVNGSDNGFKKAFEESQEEKANIARSLARANGKIDATYHMFSTINKRNEEVVMELGKFKQRCAGLEADNDELNDKIAKTEKEAERVFYRKSELQQELEAANHELNHLKAIHKSAGIKSIVEGCRIKELEAKNQELIKHVDSIGKKMKQECKAANDQSLQMQDMDEQLKSTKTELEMECAKNNVFHTKLAKYDRLADKLKEKARSARKNNKREASIEFYRMAIEAGIIGQRDKLWIGACWFGIAICYQNLKRYGEALKSIDKAIQNNQEKAAYFYNRAYSYEKLGTKPKAIIDLKKALSLDPSYKAAQDKLNTLNKPSNKSSRK